jgi:hypothetical protein
MRMNGVLMVSRHSHPGGGGGVLLAGGGQGTLIVKLIEGSDLIGGRSSPPSVPYLTGN